MRDHGAAMSDFQRHHGSKPYLLSEYPYAGYNYRLTDIQASIGSTQMNRANEIVFERKKIAKTYNNKLSDLFFSIPKRIITFLILFNLTPAYSISRNIFEEY